MTAATLLGHSASNAWCWTAGTRSTHNRAPCTLDDEMFRILTRLGVRDQFAAISRPTRGLRLVDPQASAGRIRRDPANRVHGHPQANMFDQPELEQLMRTNLKDHHTVALFTGT